MAPRFDITRVRLRTLHALGVLAALFDGTTPVAIENPEKGLHPAASGVLMDALRDGADRRQVLVTTHSADLLDVPGIGYAEILAFRSRAGVAVVGPLGPVGEKAMKESLFTPGELLRADYLQSIGVA
jgi:hypothetical protein